MSPGSRALEMNQSSVVKVTVFWEKKLETSWLMRHRSQSGGLTSEIPAWTTGFCPHLCHRDLVGC